MIEIAILYILSKYDSNIYRISKIIDEFFFAYLKTSAGTVNPCIKRLEKLSCVEFVERMSDGGMLTKTYAITSTGKKHLVDLMLSYVSKNPYHVINEAKILLYCCDILSIKELVEFKQNLLNILTLHKIKLQNGLKNEYIDLNEIQKQTINITLDELEKLIELLENQGL